MATATVVPPTEKDPSHDGGERRGFRPMTAAPGSIRGEVRAALLHKSDKRTNCC